MSKDTPTKSFVLSHKGNTLLLCHKYALFLDVYCSSTQYVPVAAFSHNDQIKRTHNPFLNKCDKDVYCGHGCDKLSPCPGPLMACDPRFENHRKIQVKPYPLFEQFTQTNPKNTCWWEHETGLGPGGMLV